MYHSFLIHSSADGHLGCFHVLAMTNSAAMNIGVHVSLSDLVSLVWMPRSGIAGTLSNTIHKNKLKMDKRSKCKTRNYRFLKTQFYLQSHCDLFSHCDLAEHFYLWSPTNYLLNQPPQCTFLRETAISLLACMLSLFSCVQLSATLWTVVCQASLLMGFSRQEYWSGSLCPPPGNLPNPGIKLESPASPALAGRFFTNAAAKSLQSCPTLCNPIPGILQARTLELVAVSFSNSAPQFSTACM